MSKDLYSDYKKLLIEQNFKTKNYSKIFDEYFRALKCQAKNCNEGKIFKKIFFHLLTKHKKLLSLKKQNDELFFQILHDIKSPALAINTVLENSERNFLDDEIYRINQSMLLLIKNFLFIYSFESGYKDFSYTSFSPWEIILSQADLNRIYLDVNNIRLKFSVDRDIKIYTQKHAFERIFANLYSNSLKYSPKNSVIEIFFGLIEDNFTLRISNEISDELIFDDKNIFEKFNTQDDSNSLGLGLFICKRLSKKIGAKLQAKILKDKIAFELTIPKKLNI